MPERFLEGTQGNQEFSPLRMPVLASALSRYESVLERARTVAIPKEHPAEALHQQQAQHRARHLASKPPPVDLIKVSLVDELFSLVLFHKTLHFP
jgi:hypothetical protein